MRIGCLQFNPQVGDVDNNLSRADSVLLKANPDNLDLLVLPELAFTGYNFKSLRDISPFLEPSGSGISSLWARTTALKYNCHVVVGYPEKVDCSKKWPTSPEYYNSAIVVNPDGETVANYRKSHLYYTDETWALESPAGFYRGLIPCLGHTSIGICMDLNPYKFQSPWDAFEFGYHVLHSESNLVIVSMAWNTSKDPERFSSMPYDPDLETLAYWATRLEPVIRAEDDDEVIVVFANRCGSEADITYSGTSAVIGIKAGEVSVYGLLGRGEKELLVVDTSQPAFAKMVLCASPQETDSPDGAQAANAAADAYIAEMLNLPLAPSHEIPEETPEEVVKASTPVAKHRPAPTPAPAPAQSDGSVSASASASKKPKPSPPKLTIPQNRGWRKDEPARSEDARQPPTTATTHSAPVTSSADGHFTDWLTSQAKAAAAHPKPSKLNPDSGIEISPVSFGIRDTANPASVSIGTRSVASTGRRHRRDRSRGSDSKYTVRSGGRSGCRTPPLSEGGGDERRNERRERRRLERFKDSPRYERPDEIILDQFLSALIQSTFSSAESLMQEHGLEPDDIKTVTLDIPEDIMIGATPSVLETSFPQILSPTRQTAPDLSPLTVAEIQALTPGDEHLPIYEMSEWESLGLYPQPLGTLAEERAERSSYAPSEARDDAPDQQQHPRAERNSMASHDGDIPFKLDIGFGSDSAAS